MRRWVVGTGTFWLLACALTACALIADLPDYTRKDTSLVGSSSGSNGGVSEDGGDEDGGPFGRDGAVDARIDPPVDVYVPPPSVTYLGCGAGPEATNGLIAYWKLDEGMGSTALDCSQKHLDGVIPQGVGYIAGHVAGAIGFDGTGFVTFGDPSALQIVGKMSIAAWVRIDDYATQGRILAKGGGTTDRGWGLNVEANQTAQFTIAVDATTSVSANTLDTSKLPLKAWFHLAGVYEPSVALRVYVNGVQAGETLTGVPAAQRNSPSLANMGRRAGDGCCLLKGQIDDLRLYGSVLTPTDIQNLSKQ